MYNNRGSAVKFKDRWLAAVPSVSESSSSSESRQFSGARSTSADSLASGRRRSLSRSISSSKARSRVRKKRVQASSSSSSSESEDSEDATSESEPPRKRLKIKKTPEEIEKEKVYKLRDTVQITGHPKSELNGICGLLEYWVVDKKLWIVRGIGNLLKQTLKIKPKFMKKVSSEEAKAAMEKIKESKEKQRLLSALLKTRMRSGLERAKAKDEENMNAKAKKMADFGVNTNGKQVIVIEEVSPSVGKKVKLKRPLIDNSSIVRRKEKSIGPPRFSIVSSKIPSTPYQAYPQYTAPLAAPYIGRICPPPMVPYGMQPASAPIFNPLPKVEPPRLPTVRPSLTSVPGKGKRPLIPTLPIAKPPIITPTETNLEEEIMDQGPDSDDEASNDGPTAPPPKYINKPPVFRFSSPPFPLGPPPMLPPTAQNTKDAPTLPNRTDPINKRKSRFEVKINDATETSFEKPPGPLSEQHLLNGGHQEPPVPLSEQRTSNISQPVPSQQNPPTRVETVPPAGVENSLLEERKSPERRKPNPEQRSRMTFEFKTLRTSRRQKKKLKFHQNKSDNAKHNKKTVQDKAVAMSEIGKAAIVTLEEMPKKENEIAVSEKRTAISDAIRDRILQINAELRKKREKLQKKKEQESNNNKDEKKSMSPSRSRVSKSKASFSRSRSRKSSSRSISRSRGRRKRRRYSSKTRSGSYSSRSRSRSSRSFSRSSSCSTRSRSKRRRRLRRRSRRSSSYSSDSSYY